MKILCHVGPWCVKQYTAIARAVDPASSIVLTSGFVDIDKSGLAKKYYKNLKSGINIDPEFDSDDFIKRCRVLRSLKRDDALLHLHAMKNAVYEMFDRYQPDIVISEVVDQYLIDLIRYESERRDIPFIGLVVSFINGYFRITARGECTKIRKVNEDEVSKVIEQLEHDAYVPKFVSKSKFQGAVFLKVLKRVISNWIRIPYFFFKRYVSKERYNYHYWASQKSAMDNFHIFPRFMLGDKKWGEKIKKNGKPIIYIPLQMYPEATIEYWCESLDVIQYHKKLIELIDIFSSDFQFVIKEHPNVLGLREPSFYRKLSKLNSVTLVPVNESSNRIVECSDAVMVWTGTAGFEAALRGKPVLTVCDPYYANGSHFKMVCAVTTPVEILSFIKKKSGKLTFTEKKKLVTNLLTCLVPGNYINNATWSGENLQDIKDAKNIGEAIKLKYSDVIAKRKGKDAFLNE